MTPVSYFLIAKLVIRWIAATGKCIKAKEAAGETIDLWDRLECAVSGLSGLEGDIVPLIEKQLYKSVK